MILLWMVSPRIVSGLKSVGMDEPLVDEESWMELDGQRPENGALTGTMLLSSTENPRTVNGSSSVDVSAFSTTADPAGGSWDGVK